MKIYVASSWRNERQPEVVGALRAAGHQVYDFRHPDVGNEGFHWSSIDPKWKTWGADDLARALEHPIAKKGYGFDIAALDDADAVVLLLPSGRSSHLEAGYARGQGKRVFVLMFEPVEPELMYRMAEGIFWSEAALLSALSKPRTPVPHPVGQKKDKRIAYGTRCTWWDSIYQVGTLSPGPGTPSIPCCPHCSGTLFEVESEEVWFGDARDFERRGNPRYVEMLTWARGKCFPAWKDAVAAFKREEEAR